MTEPIMTDIHKQIHSKILHQLPDDIIGIITQFHPYVKPITALDRINHQIKCDLIFHCQQGYNYIVDKDEYMEFVYDVINHTEIDEEDTRYIECYIGGITFRDYFNSLDKTTNQNNFNHTLLKMIFYIRDNDKNYTDFRLESILQTYESLYLKNNIPPYEDYLLFNEL
jgi:hypothetical protein